MFAVNYKEVPSAAAAVALLRGRGGASTLCRACFVCGEPHSSSHHVSIHFPSLLPDCLPACCAMLPSCLVPFVAATPCDFFWLRPFTHPSIPAGGGRYVAVSKVLETRRGRCGEYSVLMMRLLEALGYSCRWVVDWSDHVWVEARIGGNWVHIDPCEVRGLVAGAITHRRCSGRTSWL